MSNLTLKASTFVALSLILGATAAVAQQAPRSASRQIVVEPTETAAVVAAPVEVVPQAPVVEAQAAPVEVAPAEKFAPVEKIVEAPKPAPKVVVIKQRIVPQHRYSSYDQGHGYGGRTYGASYGAPASHCRGSRY